MRLSPHTAQATQTPFSRDAASKHTPQNLHDTTLKTTPVPMNLRSLNNAGSRQQLLGCSLFYELLFRCHHQLSRDERPGGSLPAFAWGDVAVWKAQPLSNPLQAGTCPGRPSTGPLLPPPSFTRSPIGSPHGSLSQKGELRAYHVPLVYPRGLGPSSTPVVLHLRQVTHEHLFLTTYLLVQACRPLAEAFSIFRLF